MSQQLQQPQTQQFQPQTQQVQPGTQQFQPQYQPSYQAQTPLGQQAQQRPFARAIGGRFDESVPSEVRHAVEDLDRVGTVAEWAKGRASERGMPRVVRVCDDLEDIAHLQKKLIIRQSPFAPAIGQASMGVIQQGLQELQQHLSEPEVQETLQEAQQSLDSISKGISALQGYGQQQVGQQQTGQQQTGQQQVGQSLPTQQYPVQQQY